MGAAMNEIGSQVRRSFIPAGREEGVPVTQGWHSLLPRTPGRAGTALRTLPPHEHHPTGKGPSGRWGGVEGLLGFTSAQGRAEGAPRPPVPGVSPPNFPLARRGGVTLSAQVTPC